ncbi:hypothetical protein JW859_07130, partial [bacterium]|nr:hypothetical protein [bacterium]
GGPVWDPLDPLYNIPDYLEGGAYILDEGEPVYPLGVEDNPTEPDPLDLVFGSTGNYTVTFNYLVQYGQAPYTIDLQMGFDYNDIGAGETALDAFGRSGETDYGVAVEPANGALTTDMAIDTLPDGDYYAAVRVTDSADPTAQAIFIWPDMVTLAPGFLFREYCDGYTNWSDAANGDNSWTRGSSDAASTTRWYVGTQFVRGTPIGEWGGMMFHCNNGADGSNGNSLYDFNGPKDWFLVSKQVAIPTGANATLEYRVRMEGNDWIYPLYYCNIRGGWTTTPSTTSTSFNAYVDPPNNTSQTPPGYYLHPESSLMELPLASAEGQSVYFKWMMHQPYQYIGAAATGAHLDAILVEAPPPAPMLPFSDDFEDGTLDKWEVTNQLWTSNNWTNRTPSQPVDFPPHSGTRVAGYSYQPTYPGYDSSTPNFGTTMVLSGGGRQAATAGSYTIGYWLDGYIETIFDDLDVYWTINGAATGSANYEGDLLGTQRTHSVSLAAGDTLQLRFYYHGDIWMYYGPQVDDVTIN